MLESLGVNQLAEAAATAPNAGIHLSASEPGATNSPTTAVIFEWFLGKLPAELRLGSRVLEPIRDALVQSLDALEKLFESNGFAG